MSNTRKCVICQTEYTYCPNCNSYNKEPRWKFLFHDQNCHDIYEVLNAYGAKQITKAEAREQLSQLDLSHKAHFAENFKRKIDEIMTSDVVDAVPVPQHHEETVQAPIEDQVGPTADYVE